MDQAAHEEFETLPPGTTLGQYRIIRLIGSGGVADVYEADHVGLSKRVAVKVLREGGNNPEIRGRFLAEGMVASRIRHPNVVDVTDVGTSGDTAFLVMELLAGENLQDVLDSTPRLTLAQAVDLMLPILAALAEAHEQGVVHRDVKPDNILLSRTRRGRVIPKLVDFGISRLSEIGPAGRPGMVVGTPQYMPPEQARGERLIDARADQFSSAMILYEAITGTLPYTAETTVGILREAAACVIPRPSLLVADLPAAAEAAIVRALSPAADDRFPIIEDFATELLPFASESGRRAYGASAQAISASLSEPARFDSSSRAFEISLPPASRVPNFARIPIDDGQTGVPPGAMPQSGPPTLTALEPIGTEPSRRRLIPLLLLLFLIGGGGASWWWLNARTGAAVPTNGLPDGPSDETTRAASGEPSDVASGDEEAPTETSDRPADSTETPEPFDVAITVEPATATLEFDGEDRGAGPMSLSLPRDGTSHHLVVRARGYLTREIVFVDAAPESPIILERAPVMAGMATRMNPPVETPDRPIPPPDNDIRLSR